MKKKEILKAISRNIRHARESANLTQEGLGELVGVHWKTIGYVESGRRDFGVSMLARIALVLKIPTGNIFDGVTLDEGRDLKLIAKATARKRKLRTKVSASSRGAKRQKN